MWAAVRRLSFGASLIVLASAALLLSDRGGRTVGADAPRRIAVLQHSSQAALDSGVDGMLAGLAQSGFTEGKDLIVQRFNAQGDLPTANAIAKQITGGGFDLVLTASTLSLQAVATANSAGKTMHVFGLVSDPFAAGVGLSRDDPLAHPAYLVGYGTMQPVRAAFELARRMLPSLHRVGTVWNPAEANSEAQLALARSACAELHIELLEATVDSTAGVLEAARSLVGRDVQAVWIPGDVTVLSAVDTVVGAARGAGIPVFTSIPGNTDHGTLFDLGADYFEVGRLAGALAAEVLHGTDPRTIAVQNVMPEKLAINAAALAGLNEPWQIPDDVVRAAERKAVAPAAARPPRLRRQAKIDLLEYVNVLDVEEAERGIRAGLRDAGLQEGTEFVLRVRNAQGDMPTLIALADAALSDGTNLLMTLSTPTLQAALRRAGNVPVVFTFVADAIAAGAGRSNDDHLPNVTGVPTAAAYRELLDLLQQCLPAAHRLGTLFVPAEVNSVYNRDQLQAAAAERGLELISVPANTSAEIADAGLSLLAQGIDAITQVASNVTTAGFVSIAQPAQRAGVPVFGFLSSDAYNGAAVVTARDYYDGGHEAGLMAARILRGERPAAIPFVPLRATRILVNPGAARKSGLELPAALLAKASEIVGDSRSR